MRYFRVEQCFCNCYDIGHLFLLSILSLQGASNTAEDRNGMKDIKPYCTASKECFLFNKLQKSKLP